MVRTALMSEQDFLRLSDQAVILSYGTALIHTHYHLIWHLERPKDLGTTYRA
jgi:hypothetical protein